jgi:hypothetical protein
MRRALGAASAIAALLAAAPIASAASQTASSGAVTAVFSYHGKVPNYSHLQLKIERSGTVVYNQKVTDKTTCGSLCWPASTKQSLKVLDLDGDGQPEVVLSLYSGGANCCYIDQVFSFDPGTNTYVKASQNFGDFGVALKPLGGVERFVGANYAFKYAFTDGADSGEPIEILKFEGHKFVDVTRDYPALIAKDAKRWLKFFKRDLKNGVGLIAAWAADEDLLGHQAQVSSYLHQQLKAGHLNSELSPKFSGKSFITKLQKFLRKLGYV